MKNFLKSFQSSLLFLIKALMFILLFSVFFGLFTYIMPQLLRINRTTAVSFSTFAISGILFIKIYGGFTIGQKKAKDIINSVFLATLMTNVVTLLEMMIMDFNNMHLAKTLECIGLTVIALFFQFVVIYMCTSLSDYVFFKINGTKKATVIYQDEQKAAAFLSKMANYKKHWNVHQATLFDDPDIKQIIRNSDTLFFVDIPQTERSQLMAYCYKHKKNIFVSPNISDIIMYNCDHVLLDDVTIFGSTISGLRVEQRFIKRLVDIVASLSILILISPIMLVTAILIKLYDHGPTLYKQRRLTKDGREFNVLKFRSMIVDAEKEGAVLSTENDDRITPVGKIIRRLRIDELPQLINILKGDMSVVGPRPERLVIMEQYEKDLPEFEYRLRVKAGLTGLAQIMGKYNTTPKDKLILDMLYIQNYSIWFDIKILFQTLIIFLKSDSVEGFADQEVFEPSETDNEQ